MNLQSKYGSSNGKLCKKIHICKQILCIFVHNFQVLELVIIGNSQKLVENTTNIISNKKGMIVAIVIVV